MLLKYCYVYNLKEFARLKKHILEEYLKCFRCVISKIILGKNIELQLKKKLPSWSGLRV